MNEAADAADVSNFVQPFAKKTANEQVTWEERLDYTHNAAPCRPFQSEARMKNFEAKMAPQCSRGNVLVPRLRSDAIPCKRVDGLYF